jgi:NADH-quinone oxidoreductase subunit J
VIATAGFAVVAASLLLAALFVISATNLVHAVLWLGVTLAGTAVLYAMLGASFLAGVQVLLYVGGVVTLMIFGVMLTRRHDGLIVRAERASRLRGGLVAAALFGVLAAAVARTELPAHAAGPPDGVTTGALGISLLTTHVLAFELLSFLLLAAIIGAVVIARKRDPGAPAPATPARTGVLRPAATITPEEPGTP